MSEFSAKFCKCDERPVKITKATPSSEYYPRRKESYWVCKKIEETDDMTAIRCSEPKTAYSYNGIH